MGKHVTAAFKKDKIYARRFAENPGKSMAFFIVEKWNSDQTDLNFLCVECPLPTEIRCHYLVHS